MERQVDKQELQRTEEVWSSHGRKQGRRGRGGKDGADGLSAWN